MKIIKTPFSNYFTTEEVDAFPGHLKTALIANNSYKIDVPLSSGKTAFFELVSIEHPIWSFQSKTLSTNSDIGKTDEIIHEALIFLKKNALSILASDLKDLSKSTASPDLKLSEEQRILIRKISRPFFFPYDDLKKFISYAHLEYNAYTEIKLLQLWRDKEINMIPFLSERVINVFNDSPDADLHSMPGVIPALYLSLSMLDTDENAQKAYHKITQVHSPDDPSRARIEAVKAIWDERWSDFFTYYKKIPVENHDWDPVPRFLLPTAVFECFNDWIELDNLLHAHTFYGGIPQYFIYGIKGCWEFTAGKYEEALQSKLIAYNSDVAKEYISIQMADILNNLKRHKEALTYFNVDVLEKINDYYEHDVLKSALNQFHHAQIELNNQDICDDVELMISSCHSDIIKKTYVTIKQEHNNLPNNSSPIKRALTGCKSST